MDTARSRRPVDLAQANEQGRVAAIQSDVPVLVTSEHPNDRRNWAQSIHSGSPRRNGPFVAFDCALSDRGRSGHPTTEDKSDADAGGDVRDQCRQASGGTLFLDRIEMMSDRVQEFLISVLNERILHRDGSVRARSIWPRIITGASGPLLSAISAGTFNKALLYRLNVIHLDFTHADGRGEHMKVRALMSTPPQTCGPETDLGAIARLMWDHDCGFMPVVEPSGKVLGVITDRDICIAAATRDRRPGSISAAETITASLHACMPDDAVSDALAMMKEFRVRRLAVVDATGQLQGVISLNDIVLASDQKRKPTPGEVVSTMAAICAHRTTQTIAVSGV